MLRQNRQIFYIISKYLRNYPLPYDIDVWRRCHDDHTVWCVVTGTYPPLPHSVELFINPFPNVPAATLNRPAGCMAQTNGARCHLSLLHTLTWHFAFSFLLSLQLSLSHLRSFNAICGDSSNRHSDIPTCYILSCRMNWLIGDNSFYFAPSFIFLLGSLFAAAKHLQDKSKMKMKMKDSGCEL